MKEINGKMFKQMVLSGAIVLHNNHPEVDALNVFPVPDGDTGTNMSLTFNSGAEQVEKLADDTSIGDIAKTLSKGLLMGARSLEVSLNHLREKKLPMLQNYLMHSLLVLKWLIKQLCVQ